MVLQAGYPTPWYGFTGRGAKARQAQYLEAVQAGYLQDYDRLAAFFLEAIRRRIRAVENET